ncbi:MAG: cell division protein FtsW [Acidimicrobiaceae bacterium]|jgi:cell division protein FtsW|nr:cell division protein FtsW [Acidimicrobiaceae bacterium]
MGSTTSVVAPRPDGRVVAAARARHPSARRPEKRVAASPFAFYALAFIVAILTVVGLTMVLSASSVKAIHADQSGWLYFRRQLIWAFLGVGALALTFRVPYQSWRRLIPFGMFVSFAMMIATLLPHVGYQVNGARAWLDVGPFTFQPSEVMKLTLIVYVADLLTRRADRLYDVRATLRPVLIVLGAALLLVVAQGDLGSGLILAGATMATLFFGGVPIIPLFLATSTMGLGGAVFALSSDYRRARWTAFLDLAGNRDGKGWQVYQALVGIASGGVGGAGIGASKAKWGFLPEAHTDFIFAILAEELGLVGVVAVCGLFLMFGFYGVQVALRCRDRFGAILAAGITAWIILQAVVNVGGVTGMMPLTGLTLPFISAGGSSLLVTMAGAGLLLNIARQRA